MAKTGLSQAQATGAVEAILKALHESVATRLVNVQDDASLEIPDVGQLFRVSRESVMSRLGGSKDKGVVQVLLFEPRRRFGGSHGPGGGPEEFTKSRELTARGGVPGSGGGLQEQAGGGHGGGGGSNE
jgi:hypothetical protein